MPVTLELILFTLIAISAVGYLIKKFQKTRKRTLGISIEFLFTNTIFARYRSHAVTMKRNWI
ncbi:hypothetical protein [Bacillus cereus]|uniref:Uncharacterized protein n=1 Tax=Bacillus cereus HuA3-9 TaxID=1053205 RepID=R8CKF2_BACCE|nr:hypothetical protein [Bacillus cereus]EOO12000.1 hypothetical protein IGA_05229 [Bacillus cereus HuA3-9]